MVPINFSPFLPNLKLLPTNSFNLRQSKICHLPIVSFLPNDKIFNKSRLKAIADDKINVTWKLNFDIGRVENIVGKGENAGYQHFLLFPQCFQKPSFSGLLKEGIVLEKEGTGTINYQTDMNHRHVKS